MIPGARTERRSNRAHPYLLHSNYRVFLVMSLENDEFPIFCFFVRGGRNKISSKARCLFRMGERRVYSFHDFCRNYPSCLRGLLTIHRLDCWVLTSLKVEKSYETIGETVMSHCVCMFPFDIPHLGNFCSCGQNRFQGSRQLKYRFNFPFFVLLTADLSRLPPSSALSHKLAQFLPILERQKYFWTFQLRKVCFPLPCSQYVVLAFFFCGCWIAWIPNSISLLFFSGESDFFGLGQIGHFIRILITIYDAVARGEGEISVSSPDIPFPQ